MFQKVLAIIPPVPAITELHLICSMGGSKSLQTSVIQISPDDKTNRKQFKLHHNFHILVWHVS